jgi:hypothetical protein
MNVVAVRAGGHGRPRDKRFRRKRNPRPILSLVSTRVCELDTNHPHRTGQPAWMTWATLLLGGGRIFEESSVQRARLRFRDPTRIRKGLMACRFDCAISPRERRCPL